MGFFSSIWDTIKTIGSVVKRVVQKAYSVLSGEKTTILYDNLETILTKTDSGYVISQQSPDFLNSISKNSIELKLSEYDNKIDECDKKIEYSSKLLSFNNEFNRLRISAELIDRTISGIKIHASSLSVHFQNMRNIKGLTNDVNSLRHAVKAIIATVNHNANIAKGADIQMQKIDGIDIEKVDGSISLVAAYDAFDRTRQYLFQEVQELVRLTDDHMRDIKNLKNTSSFIDQPLRSSVIKFIDNNIIPRITQARDAGATILDEVVQIPMAARADDGKLLFEDGTIKLIPIEYNKLLR